MVVISQVLLRWVAVKVTGVEVEVLFVANALLARETRGILGVLENEFRLLSQTLYFILELFLKLLVFEADVPQVFQFLFVQVQGVLFLRPVLFLIILHTLSSFFGESNAADLVLAHVLVWNLRCSDRSLLKISSSAVRTFSSLPRSAHLAGIDLRDVGSGVIQFAVVTHLCLLVGPLVLDRLFILDLDVVFHHEFILIWFAGSIGQELPAPCIWLALVLLYCSALIATWAIADHFFYCDIWNNGRSKAIKGWHIVAAWGHSLTFLICVYLFDWWLLSSSDLVVPKLTFSSRTYLPARNTRELVYRILVFGEDARSQGISFVRVPRRILIKLTPLDQIARLLAWNQIHHCFLARIVVPLVEKLVLHLWLDVWNQVRVSFQLRDLPSWVASLDCLLVFLQDSLLARKQGTVILLLETIDRVIRFLVFLANSVDVVLVRLEVN